MPDAPLFDHLIRSCQDCRRDRETKGLRGLRIDHEPELGRLLDGQVAGLRASEYFVDQERLTPIDLKEIYSVGYEAIVDDKFLNPAPWGGVGRASPHMTAAEAEWLNFSWSGVVRPKRQT